MIESQIRGLEEKRFGSWKRDDGQQRPDVTESICLVAIQSFLLLFYFVQHFFFFFSLPLQYLESPST